MGTMAQAAIRNGQPDLERDLRRERFAMRSLLEFARTLTPDLGPVGILKSIQRTIMGKALITDGFAYLGDNNDSARTYTLVSHSGLRAFPFPETITFEELETWLFSPPEGVRTTLPVFDSEQNDIIAFLGFGKPLVPDGELSNEENYLESLSLLAGMAITNARLFEAERERERLEAELRLAREIQLSLLPAELPQIDGLSFFAYNRQSELVGGDYYDVIKLNDHEALLVIADVVGKGASAAILMSNVQASLHALVPQLRSGMISLTKLAFILNDLIVESTSAERFVTAILAVADSSKNELHTVICGHPRPIIISRDGSDKEIAACGFPLGVIPDADYEETTTPFEEGSSVFLYTDGLSEATTQKGDSMLGSRGVHDLAKQIAIADNVAAVENLIFSDAHLTVRDDLTLVVAKRT
jgi:sigma-B regulation protein RsbU (phosphoserine phosphatase)